MRSECLSGDVLYKEVLYTGQSKCHPKNLATGGK